MGLPPDRHRRLARRPGILHKARMKIATYNVNGVNGRLPVLLRWLARGAARRRLPAGAEGAAGEISRGGDPRRRLRRDLAWPEELERRRHPRPRRRPRRDAARACPAIPRTRRAAISRRRSTGSLIGCLYLPNGNPAPGPKFDYKLRWFERLIAHAAELLASEQPVVLAGDYNVMPTDLDVYKPERWVDDALFRPEVREAYPPPCSRKAGPMRLRALHPGRARSTRSGTISGTPMPANAGLRIDHLLLSPSLAGRLVAAEVDREVRGWEKTSDHAPAWVELADAKKRGRADLQIALRRPRRVAPAALSRCRGLSNKGRGSYRTWSRAAPGVVRPAIGRAGIVSGRHLSHADAETVSKIPTEVNVAQELGVRRTQRGSRRDERRRGDGQSDEFSGF